uniref:Uncharacterized protein n=1 Tax=Anguilla anguilla TaxID=7936 RepID=A0A0E9XYZ9_ANGAN
MFLPEAVKNMDKSTVTSLIDSPWVSKTRFETQWRAWPYCLFGAKTIELSSVIFTM